MASGIPEQLKVNLIFECGDKRSIQYEGEAPRKKLKEYFQTWRCKEHSKKPVSIILTRPKVDEYGDVAGTSEEEL